MKVALFTVLLIVFTSPALAQNCRALPKGHERMACQRQYHPEKFEAMKENCKELALERGGLIKGKDFMQSCMHHKV